MMSPAQNGGVPMRQSPLPAQPGGILGCIDAIEGDRLYGWAWDPAQPRTRLPVEIYVDGARAAQMEAGLLREDLEANGVGDGYHAFEYQDPEGRILVGRQIEVRLAGRGVSLQAAGQAASVLATHALFSRLAQLEQNVGTLLAKQQETGKFYHVALKGLEMLQRDIKAHDTVLFRQDERTEEILRETSYFGAFVRKIVWNRRFLGLLALLLIVSNLFWAFLALRG
ncbi:MAG: hypothetical protein KKC98_15865 [Alphaproteobacteria bacterium]|nr:hypothetical protein [Alphaproteobacteria bacterium]MBU1811865.1 hypothetical protein [Alphaproteobacteria bacterium]MBU2091222.1 hypothetical protein [Alphaproteobacteria bacterium]